MNKGGRPHFAQVETDGKLTRVIWIMCAKNSRNPFKFVIHGSVRSFFLDTVYNDQLYMVTSLKFLRFSE